jgi:hypothetical protein
MSGRAPPDGRRARPDQETGPSKASPASVPAAIVEAADSRKCGALTSGLTRCARPPEPGSDRCALHGGVP